MTTRDEIIALAHECGLQTYITRDCYPTALERLFHAAQKQAYERAAQVCDVAGNNHKGAFSCATAIRTLIEGEAK